MKLELIIKLLNEFAPQYLAQSWDNVGLQLGSKHKDIQKIMITLTIDNKVVRHAINNKADLIIAHHPLIFKPLTSLSENLPGHKVIIDLIKNDIAVFVMHTNLDVVPGGVSFALARYCGIGGPVKILNITQREKLYKLITYVTNECHQKVLNALFEAGAGCIGDYSDCSFVLKGTGTFTPGDNTNPYIGQHGKRESVEEVRLETIVKDRDKDKVIAALINAHPYEEVAYDFFENIIQGEKYGFGCYGNLETPVTVEELAQKIKAVVKGDIVNKEIKKIAVCGGSGADLYKKVADLNISVLVTGDVGYHDEIDAAAYGVSLLDMGHYESEFPVLAIIESYLKSSYAEMVELFII